LSRVATEERFLECGECRDILTPRQVEIRPQLRCRYLVLITENEARP
jgi:hypothetical protein